MGLNPGYAEVAFEFPGLADDVVWHASGSGVISGDFVGTQAMRSASRPI